MWLAALALLGQFGLPAHWLASAATRDGQSVLCLANAPVVDGAADHEPSPETTARNCPLCAIAHAAMAAPVPPVVAVAPTVVAGAPILPARDAPRRTPRHPSDARPRAPPATV